MSKGKVGNEEADERKPGEKRNAERRPRECAGLTSAP
jgi:hypothetical protein